MRSVKIALAAGLTLLALAIGVTLLQSPISVVGTNGISTTIVPIMETTRGATYCQAHERLPAGTSAIRLSLGAFAGPRVSVIVSSGGHPVTAGTRGSGWISEVVTVPVRALPRAVPEATVCASFRLHDETITVYGSATPPAIAARNGRQTLKGRIRIEYLRRSTRSWASSAPELARRLGLGRTGAGTWNALLVLALLATVVVLASKLLLRELG